MIQVDSRVGSKELRSPILARGVSCDIGVLQYADACFEGSGPTGPTLIGVECKKLHDILACINDGRYNTQRMGMAKMYGVSFLMIEGLWKAREDGMLMEGFRDYATEKALAATGKNREIISWTLCRPGGQPVMYSKLYRYLLSVNLSGVNITFTRDLDHTAFNICEIYHYFQKPWHKHTSLLQRQQLNIPTLTSKPPLVRLWAEDLEGVGSTHGIAAQHYFRKAIRLAESDEADWIKVGLGVATAQKVIKQIRGW